MAICYECREAGNGARWCQYGWKKYLQWTQHENYEDTDRYI